MFGQGGLTNVSVVLLLAAVFSAIGIAACGGGNGDHGNDLPPELGALHDRLSDCSRTALRDLDEASDLNLVGGLLAVAVGFIPIERMGGSREGEPPPSGLVIEPIRGSRREVTPGIDPGFHEFQEAPDALNGLREIRNARSRDIVRNAWVTCGDANCRNLDGLFWYSLGNNSGAMSAEDSPDCEAALSRSAPHAEAFEDAGCGELAGRFPELSRLAARSRALDVRCRNNVVVLNFPTGCVASFASRFPCLAKIYHGEYGKLYPWWGFCTTPGREDLGGSDKPGVFLGLQSLCELRGEEFLGSA